MITFDLDNIKEKTLILKAKLIKKIFPNSITKYRISANKKGGHIKALKITLPIEEEMQIRKMIGDDNKRISKDINRKTIGIPRQILFDVKINLITGEKKEASKWKEV